MKTRALLTGVVALFLATGTAHTIEYQGKLPKPVQRLPSYPPVVCVAPNWATEPCQDRRPPEPEYWALSLAKFIDALKKLDESWIGTVIHHKEPLPWDGKWPDQEPEDDEGGFPNEVRGLWCLSPSESTKTKIILNPSIGADVCKPDEGVILISYSQFYGPNGRNDCALDTVTKIAPPKEIPEGRSSATYHVYLRCFTNEPGWTNFTIHHNTFDDGDEELVIRPSTQG
jgi:hypothetical protein